LGEAEVCIFPSLFFEKSFECFQNGPAYEPIWAGTDQNRLVLFYRKLGG